MSRTFKDAPFRVQLDRSNHKTAHHQRGCERSVAGGCWQRSVRLELDTRPGWIEERLRRVGCCWSDVWSSDAAFDEHRRRSIGTLQVGLPI